MMNFKVLDWWHKRQSKFPVLSQLVRDVLTIPVSTISSESAFSTTKMIVDERRTSLAPEMIEVEVPHFVETVDSETRADSLFKGSFTMLQRWSRAFFPFVKTRVTDTETLEF
ncbi:HAT, C-terminal dimerization domain containing protein [Trema orientale]|uniref:HAT, C-terminal dimerization domain containing protein n=1 Tax=Trema orientale TaxID=63057 RepID=A0A2P5ED40_TREOI|nr:HAT, C-terminal dimerization domain containing protein [Trema orientale]